ncbi:MAG: ATP-dependent DNA helicase RecG, partial [Anaerolineales bacterium]|nr:ATP-dependent DNA helicase RecG [Anaerolineales bacterium]
DSSIELVVSRLRDYGRLSPNSRYESLRGLWNRLRETHPELADNILLKPPTGDLSPSEAEAVIESDTLETTDPQEVIESETLGTIETREVTKSDTLETTDPQEVTRSDALETTDPQEVTRSDALGTTETQDDLPSTPLQDSADEKTVPAAVELEKKQPAPPLPPIAVTAPLTTVQGIGPKSAKTLSKLNLENLGDLLWHLPRRYDDYSQLETINRLWYGQDVTVIGTVEKIEMRVVRGGRMKLTEAVVSDGTGSLRVTWFNQPWIASKLKPGQGIVLSGKIDQYLGRLTMSSPEWEPLERHQLHTNRIVPVYPLTAGVSGKWLRRVIHSVVQRLASRIPDPIPAEIRQSAGLVPLSVALQQIHFPDDRDQLNKAQHRLAFGEMFLLQLGVLRQKQDWEQLVSEPLPVEDHWLDHFTNNLPYTLTDAQKGALDDIRKDMSSSKPMNRLLQGDVGSGKTVVAATAIGISAANKAQSAFMAPTSILADQHFQTLRELLPVAAKIPETSIRLLIGATPEAEKNEIRQALEDGTIQVIIGTHALIEDPVNFKRLGLVIIDEQHRFGVEQRAALRDKGQNPNLLVMTATPIPRSLALTVFGDLDLTLLDEMPPGRQPVDTRVLLPGERSRAHAFVDSQIEIGKQAFIIYPLVEGSEKVQTKAAVDEHQTLQENVFPSYKVGLLHGRLRQEEKEQVMDAFRKGEHEILVSTSVVEVGVDIPNATVMLIEGANHFGLAQLHQFRGRVGRGDSQSYCLLIPDRDDDTENARLTAMQATNDGFELAELDLEQRGPGDFLGTRQSGFAQLRTAQLTDIRLIEKARREAIRLFEVDPELTKPEHEALALELARFWSIEKGEIS